MPKYPSRCRTGGGISRRDFLKSTALVVGGTTVVGLVALLDACAPKEETASAPRGANEVWIVGRSFIPEEITMHLETLDTTVTWTNRDREAHTVTSVTGLFNRTLSPGDSFSYTFTEHARHRYHCSNHPEMIGNVFVEQVKGQDCETCHQA